MHNHAHYYNNLAVSKLTSFSPSLAHRKPGISRILGIGLAAMICLAPHSSADANQRDQMKRIHDRLTGVAPTNAVIDQMIAAGSPEAAAGIAMQNPAFYNVTLKNFVTAWTNEEQDIFAPLNDYTATVVGMIRDDLNFREVLYGDIIYTGSNISDYSHSNNTLYQNLESSNADLSNPGVLVRRTQSEIPGPLLNQPGATAGIMTTRAASRAFLVDGTNRAMFRFTVLNHLCYDIEQLKDNTRTADRIRQDVSRSPGGDSRLFFNNCLGCHAGMDPLVQAYANYQWAYTNDNPDAGSLEYTPGQIQPKFHINATNFSGGYFTRDSGWTNYWRNGPNAWIGWGENPTPEFNANISVNAKGVSSGVGIKSLGMELAHTDAFARCQVKKVFKTVCFRNPDSTDTANFEGMVSQFKTDYNMKQAFARAAVYCSGN